MDTPQPAPPSPTPLVDTRLRHAQEVVEQVLEIAASWEAHPSPPSHGSHLRLATLRELAFDVAIAQDALQRDGAAQDALTALRIQALRGLDEARTMLAHLIEAEAAVAARIAATQQDSAARRA